MSRDENQKLPSELRAQIDREAPGERESFERVWELLGAWDPVAGQPADADETWRALQQHLEGVPGATARPTRTRTRTDRPARARRRDRSYAGGRWIAAAVLLAVLAGGLWLWRQPVRVVAPAGQHVTVSLPDGSSVELNSGSILSYRRGFDELPLLPARRRSVSLQGEAFFEVAEGERSFIVETFNARIEVLGTRFDVRGWPEAPAPETQVTLASGRVRVAAKASSQRAVTLEQAGQTSRVVGDDAPPTPPQKANLDQVLAWRQQGFYASDQPLSVILDRLERHYGVELWLRAPSVASDAMTLYYAEETDLETILRDICRAKGLRYRATSEGYEIVQQPAPGR